LEFETRYSKLKAIKELALEGVIQWRWGILRCIGHNKGITYKRDIDCIKMRHMKKIRRLKVREDLMKVISLK